MIFVACYIAEAFKGIRSFGVEFLGLRYRIMSSANRDTLSISLPIYVGVEYEKPMRT
jgi:hypothetical protein